MLKLEWCKQLPNEEFITRTEILSPFSIYKDSKKINRFLLIPKQENLRNMLIVVNNAGIRLCRHGAWPKTLLYNVLILIQNNNYLETIKPQDNFDFKSEICDKLWKIFEYQKINNSWTVELK